MTLDTVDTIIALASGRGEAGVAVIRLSGQESLEIVSKIFVPSSNRRVNISGKLQYGSVVAKTGEAIDDCMVAQMPGPYSFTGENVAEIQCHGSLAVVRRIIDRCLECGARPAEPGEFSRRAFLNGKMDLAQAEALSDLIASRSEAARKLALNQLRGGLSSRVRKVYSDLLDAAAEIEAHIDFPEEDIPAIARDRILLHLEFAENEMQRLLHGHDKARLCAQGARVILAGEPNAGKSSLFNALVGKERAIVSPHPGTTRDTIEAVLEIAGLAITLVDTAGIRPGAGEIEQIGIDRTRAEIREADLVLHLIPYGNHIQEPNPLLDDDSSAKVILVMTKADLSETLHTDGIAVSSVSGLGLPELEDAIRERLADSMEESEEVEMSRVRHAECLRAALQSLDRAKQAFAPGESGDLVMVDLRDALSHVGEILGERLDEQILDRIFSTFCLGK